MATFKGKPELNELQGVGAGAVVAPERYLIKDRKTQTYQNSTGYSTASRANNAVDKLDAAYGGYRYMVVPYSTAVAREKHLQMGPDKDLSTAAPVAARLILGGATAAAKAAKAGEYGEDESRAANENEDSDVNPRDAVRGQRGYSKGGSVSASRRGDGIAQRGKTKGRMC